MSFYYHIYGLTISSSRQIAVLNEAAATRQDLDIEWTTDNTETPDPELIWEPIVTNELRFRKQITFFNAVTPAGLLYKICFKSEYGGLFFLLNPDKTQLWIVHSPTEPIANLDSYFVGSILGCVLRLMGKLCLHSSVINLHGKAVLFLGAKRSGKSTTAAAFSQMGFKILSDDIAAVTATNQGFYIEPGYAKVRLRPQSLAMLHQESPENFPAVYTTRDSRYADIKASFQDASLPLGAIYILNRNDEHNGYPTLEPVSTKALMYIHNHTFASYVITPDLRKEEFNLIGQLATKVPVKLLSYGSNVQLVNSQCEAVLQDFTSTDN